MARVTATFAGLRGLGNNEHGAWVGLDQNPSLFAMRLAAQAVTYRSNGRSVDAPPFTAGAMTGGRLGNFGDTANVRTASTGSRG